MTTYALPLAAAAGFPWMNLVWVLVGIAIFVCLLAAVGRWLASTHPDPEPRVSAFSPTPAPAAPAATPPAATDPEIEVIIAAAVHAALGGSARIMAVVPKEQVKMSVDSLMLQWSLEGRREIYSSHRVR
jgi:hypothetical protein